MNNVKDQRIAWLDLETGGLDEMKHQILEIGAVAASAETFEIVDEFEVRLKLEPGHYDEEALKINHYSEERWADAVDSEEAMKRWCHFLHRHATRKMVSKRTGKPYNVALLGGHNVCNFDLLFLRAWKARHKDPFWPAALWNGGLFDTLHMAQTFLLCTKESVENLKLETLLRYFDIKLPPEQAHTALADARATCQLAQAFVEALNRERP